MREIKFRVFDKDYRKMHIVGKDGHDSLTCWDGKIKYYNLQNGEGSGEHGSYILMQYTGLKDKNGKEIYEGDVVKTHDQNNIIQYQHGSFMLIGLYEDRYERNYSRLYHYLIDSTIPNMDGSRFDGVTTTLEIIGNIYENPELLEQHHD